VIRLFPCKNVLDIVMLRPAILNGHFQRAIIMNKQKLPACKLVINCWAGYYPLVIVEQNLSFLLVKFNAFLAVDSFSALHCYRTATTERNINCINLTQFRQRQEEKAVRQVLVVRCKGKLEDRIIHRV
jgi:hypothetical protein